MVKRRYTLRQRADSQEDTRRRIVEATAHLHEELGPRDTTISAIAEKAGVQRLTVYRHFPDETALFQACTAHWLALNPPPDPASWAGVEGFERVGAALVQLYLYYRRTERMWTVCHRDEADVAALREPMLRVRDYLGGIRDDLVRGFAPVPATATGMHATLGCAVEFGTWQSLARQGLDDPAMAALVCDWLRGAAPEALGSKRG